MDWAWHILTVLVIVYLGICLAYFLLQEKFIFVPSWPTDHFQPRISTPVEQIFLDTPHGGRVHAILIRAAEPRGLIFYLHGNTGSLYRWQFMAEELTTYGFDVVAMDYRGYGQSQGPRRESWMHRDAEAMLDEVTSRMPDLPVVIYGRSLGSGFATRLASRRRCSGLVLETPFSNLVDVAAHYLPFIPVRLLLRYRFRSDLHINHVHCPVLILHGTRDFIVPHRFALRLFQAARGKANVHMTTITGGRHSNLNAFPLFREKLADFLESL